MHFDNSISERIDNEIELLSHLNDTPTAYVQAVTKSKFIREKKSYTKK